MSDVERTTKSASARRPPAMKGVRSLIGTGPRLTPAAWGAGAATGPDVEPEGFGARAGVAKVTSRAKPKTVLPATPEISYRWGPLSGFGIAEENWTCRLSACADAANAALTPAVLSAATTVPPLVSANA